MDGRLLPYLAQNRPFHDDRSVNPDFMASPPRRTPSLGLTPRTWLQSARASLSHIIRPPVPPLPNIEETHASAGGVQPGS